MLTSGPVGGGLAGVCPVPLTSHGGWIVVEKELEDTIRTDTKKFLDLRNAHFLNEAKNTCVLFGFTPVYTEITNSIS